MRLYSWFFAFDLLLVVTVTLLQVSSHLKLSNKLFVFLFSFILGKKRTETVRSCD